MYTVAGQSFNLPINIATGGADIIVTASKVTNAGTVSKGPATVLGSEQISQIASINRDIRDLMRRDPFATLDTSSTSGRNVSFAGQNARYNRFTIDGVPITDGFGLNPDGLPSRRGPVPLDAIEQFQTKIAPYDVRDGFFQGGTVNAILKSGTNNFHGTAFYTYSSDGLIGSRTKPYITNTTGIINSPKYKDRDFGAELSGPIIADKLFFMVAGERVRASKPINSGTVETNAGSPVPGVTDAIVSQIVGIAKTKYGYDAGGVLRSNGDKDDRLVAKLDANISDTQRASLTYIYTKDSLITATTNSNTSLGLESNAYTKPNRVHAGIFQLNSQWSSSFSTEARVLYKDYKSGQIPLLANGAQFTICTAPTSDRSDPAGLPAQTNLSTVCPVGTPSVLIGPGGPSQFNVLRTKTWGGSLVTRLSLNDHNLRLLADYQNVDTFNLFVSPGNGTYYFDSIADYQAGNAQSFNYSNAASLNQQDAAASFRYQTYTFGIQDDWRVNDMLNVSYGARYDLFGFSSRPATNPFFQSRYGFTNTSYINGLGLFQPRVGFDFHPISRISIRGGGGIFGGGTPDVYVSNSFANSGVLQNSLSAVLTNGGTYQVNGANTTTANGQSILNNVNISQISPSAGVQTVLNNRTSTAALDPNFKAPSQFRATLSADYRANLGPLGDGWNFGADFFYSKVRNQVLFTDIRSIPVAGSFTPDGRQRYQNAIPGVSNTDGNNDILLTNSKLGRSYVGVVRFEKTFDFGVNFFGSYTRQDVKDQNPATSSVALSNYSNGAYLDPNVVAYGPSNDQVKWSFKYGVGFDRKLFGDNHTRLNLFGETRAGSPFSYTFQDATGNRSSVFGTTGSNSRYLFYVPTVNDPRVTYDSVATQAAVEAIITGSGLAGYRGQIAPRNAFRSKAFTKIDLHLEQELPLPLGSKFTVFGDIENFTNLLNHKWGQQLRATFNYNKSVVRVTCVAAGANTCAQYQYSSPTPANLLADQLVTANGSSLYAIRIGARISF
ncbi:TonB-dependent receptor plug domain-containing protein [Sphingomonas paeninsulae]|uniref:TonB-dependent receptor plug domain-containing protein n=1 Tax=Sphingomonas paeninsulae TaxID=2319844 RepID=UPI001EF00B1C|nr:TonB-dependent receptor plug domain-containing protein [Sphingomonas paeninsulae]